MSTGSLYGAGLYGRGLYGEGYPVVEAAARGSATSGGRAGVAVTASAGLRGNATSAGRAGATRVMGASGRASSQSAGRAGATAVWGVRGSAGASTTGQATAHRTAGAGLSPAQVTSSGRAKPATEFLQSAARGSAEATVQASASVTRNTSGKAQGETAGRAAGRAVTQAAAQVNAVSGGYAAIGFGGTSAARSAATSGGRARPKVFRPGRVPDVNLTSHGDAVASLIVRRAIRGSAVSEASAKARVALGASLRGVGAETTGRAIPQTTNIVSLRSAVLVTGGHAVLSDLWWPVPIEDTVWERIRG